MAVPSASHLLRLGTRASLLAQKQSGMIADLLMAAHPGLHVELVLCKTTGDKVQDRPLHELGGKGLFTKELEEALLARTIDLAVHSFKDVPVTMPLVDQTGLVIAAVPKREDPRDVLVSMAGKSLRELPQGVTIGTGSLRRRAQALAIGPDLNVQMIRGNIDTRIRKMREGQYHAVILAMAGLKRSGLFQSQSMHPIDLADMLPAPAQGALAVQCRKEDSQTRALLRVLNDPLSHACVDLERQVVLALNGNCHSPIAALATHNGESTTLRVVVGAHGGGLPLIRAMAECPSINTAPALAWVIDSLGKQGVEKLLAAPLDDLK